MKSLAFHAVIVAEDINPSIKSVIENLASGEYEVEMTDDFIGDPVIYLSKKVIPELSTENVEKSGDEAK